jgi:hypothetical protein
VRSQREAAHTSGIITMRVHCLKMGQTLIMKSPGGRFTGSREDDDIHRYVLNKFNDNLDLALLAPSHDHVISPLFQQTFSARGEVAKKAVFYEDLPFCKNL